MRRDDATQAQVDAADPTRSTWLSANAGSGKTRVLTDRVARLLLDGVRPDHILCLTYTKAAASEMQNRLFKRLGDWAMSSDAALTTALSELGAAPNGAHDLGAARTLFARAIETPGGLRIQTIHSFCAGLLRRFPLEAGVSPQFTEMEDRAADRLRAEVLDDMATGPDAGVLDAVAPLVSDLTFEDLAARVAADRQGFSKILSAEDIQAAYGLPPGLTLDGLVSDVLRPEVLQMLRALEPVLAGSTAMDTKVAAGLASVTPDAQGLANLEKHLLFGPKAKVPFGAKRGSVPTKALVKSGAVDAWLPEFEALMDKVEDAREARLALAAVARDAALHRFAAAFLPRYRAQKQARGWLDFDDLIERTGFLLTDPAVAQWVLYRLDGGIDHILVDEAQDTSPAQWAVITRLAQEFTSGEGARTDVTRTIFVVGDKKQSIYSFQGADAAEFDRMQADFDARLANAGAGLRVRSLEFSFRSAAQILSVVDETFSARDGSGFAGARHRAFKADMPGRVDLWPLVAKSDTPEPADWRAPVDHVSPEHHSVRMARRIAEQIAQLLDQGHPIPRGNGIATPITAGDILILVRKRSALFGEIIRACKALGLPIAGADRLKVMAELAVRDILAVLRFVATPEDDLSLATALRSPIFGLSEQALYDIAQPRAKGAFLWEALRGAQSTHSDVLHILQDLLDQADFLRPYEMIERLLTRHGARVRLMGRLGDEAADGIDALLAQALSYERTEVPSLTGFLEWAGTDDLEIKRETGAAGDKLRVMTVHGAKGLEAPVVILPDCTKPTPPPGKILVQDRHGAMWRAVADERPARQSAPIAVEQAAAEAEEDRLLYVAMTRAESWLIVGAVDALDKAGRDWYSQVRRGLAQAGGVPHVFDFGAQGQGEGLRLQGDWPTLAVPRTHPQVTPATGLPDWAKTAVPRESPHLLRSPSDLGGAKALPGAADQTDVAMARGTSLHLLLEHLPQVPPEDWVALAEVLLPETPGRDSLLAEARLVLNDPASAWVFASDTLAEVPVSAEVPGLGQMYGVIDRLQVGPKRVRLVDFKSNRVFPKALSFVPEGVLRQLGAYAAMVAPMYPGREISVSVLWTAGPMLMDIPHDLVTSALTRAELDVGEGEP